MKFAALLLLALPVLLTSCASTSGSGRENVKFNEADSANFVIRYNSDKTIFRLKPDAHEGAFQRIYTKNQVVDLDAKRPGARNMAVVIISFNRVERVEHEIKQNWVQTLSQLNYRRVVFLRASEDDTVNGLRIVEDRILPQVASTSREVTVAGSNAE